MPTPRSAHAVALAVAVLIACGERAPPAPLAPSAPATGTPATIEPAPTKPADGAAAVPAGGPAAAQVAPTGGTPVPGAAAPAAGIATAPGAAPAPGSAAAPGTAAPAGASTTSLPPPAQPASVTTVLREVVALEPGGATLPLALQGDTVVDPGARFRVVLSISSPDARVLLLDAKDALVAAEGAHEVGQTTRLTLTPSAPLTPGRRYLLRVDGASTRELHDASGKAFGPAAVQILVAGEPPPPEPKEQPTRRKRRSR